MPSEIFDDEFRRRLEVLKRLVARALAGRGGAGRSPLHERGGRVEFADHRAYVHGDDPASIDWAVYARLEALVVKEFEAPKEGHLLLIVDRSASMGCFGKDGCALRLAAALGWLGLASGARVACSASGGASRWIAGQERFPELLDALRKISQGGVADLPGAVERAPASGTGRRTALVLSDLYEAKEAARALAALQRRASTLVCVHVLAAQELRAPDAPAARLEDAETGKHLTLALDREMRARFHQAAEGFLSDRTALAARHGARLVRIQPEDDLVSSVERIVVGGSGA